MRSRLESSPHHPPRLPRITDWIPVLVLGPAERVRERERASMSARFCISRSRLSCWWCCASVSHRRAGSTRNKSTLRLSHRILQLRLPGLARVLRTYLNQNKHTAVVHIRCIGTVSVIAFCSPSGFPVHIDRCNRHSCFLVRHFQFFHWSFWDRHQSCRLLACSTCLKVLW